MLICDYFASSMDQGVLHEKVRRLDKSRSGYLAVITKVCNDIDKLIDPDKTDIELLQQLESRLLEAFNKYKDCCEGYALLLDENCDKYLDVVAHYHAQGQRVRVYIKRLDILVSEAVKSEISKLELEIQQSECELQRTIMSSNSIQSVNKTLGHSLSGDEPMTLDYLQENDNACNDCNVIPPPPMFADVATPQVDATLPKTSTPFVTPHNVSITLPVMFETKEHSPTFCSQV